MLETLEEVANGRTKDQAGIQAGALLQWRL
jgi:hypothetical protein